MKLITAFFSAALCVAIASAAYAQSLADIAKKEKERREQIHKKADVITNDTVSEYSGGSVSTVTPPAVPSDKTDSDNIEGDTESEKQGEKVDSDEPVDFQGRPESYWRETMTAARKKVKDLDNEANVLTLSDKAEAGYGHHLIHCGVFPENPLHLAQYLICAFNAGAGW